MELYIEKFKADCSWHQYSALTIEQWTKESSATMLPVHHSELSEHPFGVLAEHKGSLGVMGYVAVKNLSEDGRVGHIGTLVSNPHYREFGIASQCLDFLLANCQLYLPKMTEVFAYVNEKSAPLFLAKGGCDLSERNILSSTNCNLVVNMTPAIIGTKDS